MAFSDLEWPADAHLFPKHSTVLGYIEAYASDVKHLIAFNTDVVSIDRQLDSTNVPRWSVRTATGAGHTHHDAFDAVVVANGHFNVPHVPAMRGLEQWLESHPGTVSHSMLFKSPEVYRDQKVLLIGNGASGVDIADHVSTTCTLPLLHSQRSESFLLSDPGPRKTILPDVSHFEPETRSVVFIGGHAERDIDLVLFCTGYFYSYPFLDLDPPLIGDGTHVQNLYQHLFYRPDPTIAFPALQQRVIPFPMAEAQAAVVARVWSGRLRLPDETTMRQWEDAQYEETGGGRNFHLLKFPKDADYINAMHDLAASADKEESTGKTPPRWNEEHYWLRERFPQIKKAYHDKGVDRLKVKTIEELGFDYKAWKREQEVENKTLI